MPSCERGVCRKSLTGGVGYCWNFGCPSFVANVATTTGEAYAASFVGGFAAGAVQTGNLRGAVVGGISSIAFYGIGQKFSVKGVNIASGEGMAAYSKLVLASGVTGGVMAELQGGRFGNGFVTAGASAFLAPVPEAAASNPGTQTVIAAVVGGTISRIGGGKFANGAVTSAFQFGLGKALDENGYEGTTTGSSAAGDLDPVQVPSVISIDASGFPTLDDAARDVGARYGKIGAITHRELQTSFVFDSATNSWGYLTPGWGPPESTRIDTAALKAAYEKFLAPKGQYLSSWMHGHWDGQLNFSSVDFDSVWHKKYSVYMVNKSGEVRRLNNGHLQRGLRGMSGSLLPKTLQGLKSYYETKGLAGDPL